MSFGWSVSDIIKLIESTVELYEKYKSAPKEFARVRERLQTLTTLLSSLKEEAEDQRSILKREPYTTLIGTLIKGFGNDLKSLRDLEKTYHGVLSRLSYSKSKLLQAEAQLSNHLNELNGFLAIANTGSQGRQERHLSDLMDKDSRSPRVARVQEIPKHKHTGLIMIDMRELERGWFRYRNRPRNTPKTTNISIFITMHDASSEFGLSDKDVEVIVPIDKTIEDVKGALKDKFGVPITQQLLEFDSELLENHRTILDCGLENENRLYGVIIPRDRVKNPPTRTSYWAFEDC